MLPLSVMHDMLLCVYVFCGQRYHLSGFPPWSQHQPFLSLNAAFVLPGKMRGRRLKIIRCSIVKKSIKLALGILRNCERKEAFWQQEKGFSITISEGWYVKKCSTFLLSGVGVTFLILSFKILILWAKKVCVDKATFAYFVPSHHWTVLVTARLKKNAPSSLILGMFLGLL